MGPRRADIAELRALIDLANRYLSRLFKVEHYYNRMIEMETVIAQMQTVMESMTDPVILTDPQHRVITQNKAARAVLQSSGRCERRPSAGGRAEQSPVLGGAVFHGGLGQTNPRAT